MKPVQMLQVVFTNQELHGNCMDIKISQRKLQHKQMYGSMYEDRLPHNIAAHPSICGSIARFRNRALQKRALETCVTVYGAPAVSYIKSNQMELNFYI